MKVIAISGSLRRESHNAQLLREAAALAPAGVEVELGVSVNTVSFHVRHIYQKLQVHSRSDAVAKALREGLIR